MALNDLIILRKGSDIEWSGTNPVLASGEPGYDTVNKVFKIGDGSSTWLTLSGINIASSQITDLNSSVSGLLPANIVNGSGIGSYTAKWSDSDTLTTGILYDNGNNIGIGTSSPLAKLHIINQNTFQNPNVIIYDSASLASGVGASIILGGKFNTAGSYGDFAEIKSIKESDANNNASASLAFFTTNVADLNERMRITSGGNLGVGTNNPTSRLQVEGGNVVFNDAGGDFDFRVEGDTVQNLLFTDASADSVGIGTNAPAAPLHLVGSKHTNFGSFLIQDSTNFAQNVGGSIVLGGKYNSTGEYARFGQVAALKANSTDGDTQGVLSFSSNDGSVFAERMRILPSGNVAFGSTGSDSHRFSIRGNINQNNAIGIFSDTAYGSAATSGNVYDVYSRGQLNAYTLQNYYHFFSTLPTLSNGAVINNELCFTATNNATANVVSQRGFYSTINGSNSWQLFMDGTAPSFIRGNVGIGTSAPTHLLQVEGGNVVFNDAGGNFDFRVEGDSDANLLFTDASTDTVNIGTGTSTGSKLLVSTSNSRSYQHILASGGIATESSFIRVANDSNVTSDSFAGFTMSATRSSSSVAQIASIMCVATNASTHQPNIVFIARNSASTFAEVMRINHLGDVGIGTSSPAYKLDVVGSGNFSQNLSVNGVAVSVNGHVHTPRAVSASDTSGTLTPNSDTTDLYVAEGLTGAITFAIPSGTPVNGQKLLIRLKDNGTARGITWTTSSGGYRAIGVTLPTTTVISKTTYIGCIYNSADSFWDVIAIVTQS